MTKDGAKSLAEPCLLSGIGGDLILGITSKTVEFPHILMNGHLSLIQIAELFLLALHQLIQNVVPSKGNTELLPSHYVTIWLHCNIGLPPLKSSTFQEVYRENNSVIGSNMCCIKLTLDGTEPIINFKGLIRTSEYRWLEEDEVLNADHHIMMVGGILLDDLQKACLITSIPLSFHHDFHRRRRWWRFIIISIPISVLIPKNNTTSST
nr:hypothetical protein [uncultured organism]